MHLPQFVPASKVVKRRRKNLGIKEECRYLFLQRNVYIHTTISKESWLCRLKSLKKHLAWDIDFGTNSIQLSAEVIYEGNYLSGISRVKRLHVKGQKTYNVAHLMFTSKEVHACVWASLIECKKDLWLATKWLMEWTYIYDCMTIQDYSTHITGVSFSLLAVKKQMFMIGNFMYWGIQMTSSC